MALQADLLESIPQTRYLSAETYVSYRAIMRTFYLEYQKMHQPSWAGVFLMPVLLKSRPRVAFSYHQGPPAPDQRERQRA